VHYLPSLFAGALIIIAGILLARLSRDLVTAAAPSSAQRLLLGRVTQLSILATAIVIGADQIGIKINFLVIMATVVVSTVLGGGALALSLGARTYVANLIGAHYLRQAYCVGQRIRVAGYEGHILEITPTTVILETAEGRATLPARLFQEDPSVALMGENNGTGKNQT
jgi:small-conductance mechanosensitive channel